MSYSILFVDDDKSILKSIKREFFSTPYELYFASGGEEALKILYENNIDIVVSDIMMPEMNGYELLKKIKYIYPKVVRMVLSGYTDEKLTFKIINTNLAKNFLNKPWKENELIIGIEDTIALNKQLDNEVLRELLNSTNKLPTLPLLYNEINSMIDNDESNLDDIIDLINKDQVMTFKILKIVNSAFYGLKTGSIKTAIVSIGLSNLKNIIATTEILYLDGSEYGDLLWRHCNITNILTIKLYEVIFHKKIPDLYSTAGLLHDIGRVGLLRVYGDEYIRVLKLKEENPESSLPELERDNFRISHEELGSIIMNYWEFPSVLVETALNHHKPEASSIANKDIIRIVHLADYYSWEIVNKNFINKLDDKVFEYLAIDKIQVEKIVDSVRIDIQ